ncbi:MAG: amidohydrolase family protein [Betaproteobacteria bacterium]|nr:amidohydrolase family protein [Betaproteobacteria bacterium]
MNDLRSIDRKRREFLKASAALSMSPLIAGCAAMGAQPSPGAGPADLVLLNGRIATQDERRSVVQAVAIKDGRIYATGDDAGIARYRGPMTRSVDLNRRTVIPGLIDSHSHPIRGGLYYNLELRWDGVPSLADGLRMLREQALRTPPNQWVRVVGGWSEFQFAEKRMPTLDELNAAAPETPVFVLNLYASALLNRAALRAAGYDRNTPNPPGGEIQRDRSGEPTGLLIAKPNAFILYSTLAKGPKLPFEQQLNSTRQFMRELNRFGVTSVIDAGGGFQNYPQDYEVVSALHRDNLSTIRLAANLFTQRPNQELDDFSTWVKSVKAGQGDDMYRINGGGEMLVYSAADFEDFVEPRPDMPNRMEGELTAVVKLLAEQRWPFRLHATYDETITRALNVFEAVNREVPLEGLHWFIDHAETISPRNIDRVRAMQGGIAVQHRMAFQGENFIARYGKAQAEHSPPIKRMLAAGVPVGAGTDATRVASYNPFVSLYWLVAGKTVGGTAIYTDENRLERMEALRRWTVGSAWFSSEESKKGALVPGQLADLAVLSADYFSIPEDDIKKLESVLTIVGGKAVYANAEFKDLSPPPLPIMPEWSPVAQYGGYGAPLAKRAAARPPDHAALAAGGSAALHQHGFWGSGCDCFV